MQSSTANRNVLARNGIKKICESDNIAEDFKNMEMIFQVVSVEIFGEDQQRKNIKGRIHISDGVSKLIVMISDKAYQLCEQAGMEFEKH